VTEEEAKNWIASRFDVPRETWDRLDHYVALLLEGMKSQNLIAESTASCIWARHIADSAQLLPLARQAGAGPWIDLGAGAGLPGIVVAILSDRPVTLIESRRRRIDFLRQVVAELDLDRTTVLGGRVETAPTCQAAVISARAYAPIERLLSSAQHLSGPKTQWLLPKGRTAQNELEVASRSWQAVFHVEPSVTDPDSAIILARSVQRLRRTGRS
jgi:16S rRNA (guanine527-N7)-methyltransferase